MLEKPEVRNWKFTKLLTESFRQSNREIINPMLPSLAIQSIIPVAVMAAKLRDYRDVCDEALTVSPSLEQTISRGYLELSELV